MRYTFLNISTKQVEEHYMRMSEYDTFTDSNPHLERYHEPGQAAAMGDSVRLGIRKPDNGFQEVLSKIHSANYRSNLASKLSRK
tara:strand:- start:316 stop:567 length:252 start_codon:yes stop_codon:yes gene_type:complete